MRHEDCPKEGSLFFAFSFFASTLFYLQYMLDLRAV